MSAAPETVSIETSRDRRNWWQSAWIRRVLLLIPTAVVALGLADVFGQRPSHESAIAPAARLTVDAPTHARSGLLYAARFRIDARENLRKATLILDSGWANGYTVNGEAPQPLTQGSADGRLSFGFGHIEPGKHVTFWLSLQVNPTTVGSQPQTVRLYDGSKQLLVLRRHIFVFP